MKREIHPVVLVTAIIGSGLLIAGILIARDGFPQPCEEWTNVTMPAEKIEQIFIVKDDDGTHHRITVPVYRPSHSHRICTSSKP